MGVLALSKIMWLFCISTCLVSGHVKPINLGMCLSPGYGMSNVWKGAEFVKDSELSHPTMLA
jgi:hypothetical protein